MKTENQAEVANPGLLSYNWHVTVCVLHIIITVINRLADGCSERT